MSIVGEVLAYGGGAATIAFLIFRFLGKSWIENKFAQKLDQFRHEQALDLQRLRVKIDALLSGALTLQQKEFELLPIAWEKLDKASGSVSSLVSPAQRYPNLDRMTPAQLDEYLETTDLYETQKESIRVSEEKVNQYMKEIFPHQLHSVKECCSDFHNFVVRHSIFFPPELKENLVKVAEQLWQAISSKELASQMEDFKFQSDGWRAIQKDIRPFCTAIEKQIFVRLQKHGTSD